MSGAAHFSNSVFRKTSWAMTSLTASLMIAAPVQAAGEAAVVTPWGTVNEPAGLQATTGHVGPQGWLAGQRRQCGARLQT